MAYTLSLTNNTPLTTLSDGVVDSDTTSISLIGKNVSNFGDAQNENFLHMLENFSNSSQPSNSLKGQLWFNSSEAVLRPAVYDGINWRPLAVLLYSNTTTDTLLNGAGKDWAANRQGDLWFDSFNKQLHIITANTGSGPLTTLIGPEAVAGFGSTKMSSTKMYDTVNKDHPVIQMIIDGEVIGVMSTATFTQRTADAVPGFLKINRGLTFKNYNSSTLYTTATTDVLLHGLHEQLDTTVVRRNVAEHIQSSWYIDNGNVLNFGTAGQSTISWNTTTSNITLTSTGGIKLQSATASINFDGQSITASTSTVNLGTTSTRYNAVYSKKINCIDIESDTFVVSNVTAQVVGSTSLYSNLISSTIANFQTLVATTVTAQTLVATTVTAQTLVGGAVYDNNARVLTTATFASYGTDFIRGTSNQVVVTPTSGTVVLSLADNVKIKQLQGGGTANTGTISGVWTLTAGSTLQATFADLAERYQADTQYEPGTVLEFGGDFEVTLAEDSTRRVAGVVTTNPAHLMNVQLQGPNVVSLALTGRVPCKVRGKISKGDMMVSAGSGYARSEYSPILGSVIGKALEDFDGVEGVIEVVVGRL